MAAFCRYWRMTPSEFRSLRWDEYTAMVEYMDEEARAQKRKR